MSNISDMLLRIAGASSVGGSIGARIGGSVSAVFGPAAAGGAAVGGLFGSVIGGGIALVSEFL